MAFVTLEEPRPKAPPKGFALFELGFRSFFLAAGAFGVVYMGIWLATLVGWVQLPPGLSPLAWHGHEMIFGYAMAVIAGFLLTATQNWTGIPMPKGGALGALFALWLAGRVLPYVPNLPYGVAALVDLAFLPVLAIAVARPVLKAQQTRNYAFPLMLLAIWLANLLSQYGLIHNEAGPAVGGLTLALYLIVLIIVIMGGRVIPYFTERRINSTARKWEFIEWLSPASVIAVLIALLFAVKASILLMILFAAAAVVHAIRLAGWQAMRLWSIPLLWVLHLGYGWIVVGFVLDALAAAGMISPFLAMHAYAIGGIGVLTLGMMSRVALGHTGRPLEISPLMPWAFALINLATLVRVFGPLINPAQTAAIHQLSGILWMLAFAIFVAIYAPMLWNPRVDGKPG